MIYSCGRHNGTQPLEFLNVEGTDLKCTFLGVYCIDHSSTRMKASLGQLVLEACVPLDGRE